MPTILEFIGFAGSGKTFISRRLRDELGEGCVLISELEVGALDVLSFSVVHPLSVVYAILFIVSTKQPNRKLALGYIKEIIKYRLRIDKAMRSKHKCLLIDEGMLHKLRNIRGTSTISNLTYNDIRLSYRRDLFSKANIVVYVDAPLATIAYRRLKRRNASPDLSLMNKQIAHIKLEVEKRRKGTEQDINAARNEHSFEYLEVYNKENESVDAIIRVIKNRLGNTTC